VRVPLARIAFARSGDKGDTANVGVIALAPAAYEHLLREVTSDRVRDHFSGVCRGAVERFELPNLFALNFLLHESGLLSLEVDVPEEVVTECDRVVAGEIPGRPGAEEPTG
jgi:hypothetical protein